MPEPVASDRAVCGEFVDFAGSRHYVIRNVDRMPPFLVSVISSSDHWLFVSSTGGLTAGRVSPDTALFPYVTDDKLHEIGLHTGPRTIVRIDVDGQPILWEPFNLEQHGRFATSRNLYKSMGGDRLCFEEINHDLELLFRYTWLTSDRLGFVRRCELQHLGSASRTVTVLDGLQNILPAGTPRFTQTNSSNLVDAYKWTELDGDSGLALFTLYAGITDRAEPCESLKANVAYCLGFDAPTILLSSAQVEHFCRGEPLRHESHRRGVRGAFLVSKRLWLEPGSTQSWDIVCDLELSQKKVVDLQIQLAEPATLAGLLEASISRGSDALARIMARCDGFEATAEEHVTAHHYANVLFNVLRGGYFPDQYRVSARDFHDTIRTFNKVVHSRAIALLDSLPETIEYPELLTRV
ncbi:MAG TPA: hypothetical protein VLT59_10445 [Steroidobacteraceae bacterium]|nr:hypothetical protein [Steroidobacteraceae bacterium]